ncbi:MAG TPA: hypothetical protein PLK46_13925 [Propioniciclava sp.]|uniref:DUF6668 family protein n=2 Tax=Actinomycetes TaxID=1760 RepID=UPI002C49D505|nr:DUF6668 family protein [Propioniciclava sp.]HRL81412.1 hypothetical protein [Propioniciclava sp.]
MTEQNNPWLSRPASPPPTIAATTDVPVARPTGPTAPQRGVPVPDHVDQLRIVEQHRPAELWWVGAHGGAGESTLAGLAPEWPAAGHAWPRTPAPAPAPVVLVARSNAHGLRAAQTAIMQWAGGLVPSVDVLGLVIVADAPGRLPRPLRDLAQVVSGGVPRTWNVPWVESWRLGEPPALNDAPREVRRLVDELRVILGPGAAGTTNWKEER